MKRFVRAHIEANQFDEILEIVKFWQENNHEYKSKYSN